MKTDRLKMGASIIIPAIIFTLAGVAVYAHEGGGFQGGERPNLTEEQREVLEQVHALKESGDIEGARALAEEAGLPKFGKHGRGGGNHGAVKEAIENEDYAAFVEATKDAPFADMVDEAFFAKMVEACELREAGDKEGAKAIMEELGIERPHKGDKRGPGKFFRMHADDITDEQKELMREAKELHQAGDHEGAKDIMEQLRNELKTN